MAPSGCTRNRLIACHADRSSEYNELRNVVKYNKHETIKYVNISVSCYDEPSRMSDSERHGNGDSSIFV